MRDYTELSQIKAEIERHTVCLLFIKMANCDVCDVTYEKTIKLLDNYQQVHRIAASIEQIPSLAGEYLVLTAPTILLFFDGKEVFRQSRFVLFGEFEQVLKNVVEAASLNPPG